MNMVIPNEGKLAFLNVMLPDDGTDQEDFYVRLYKNNYTPVNGSTGADFTEADFTGYSQVAIARSDFTDPYISSNVAFTDSAVIPVYTCTGGSAQTVYGWYMVGQTTGTVYAAQKFDAARSMASGAEEHLDPFSIGLQTLH